MKINLNFTEDSRWDDIVFAAIEKGLTESAILIKNEAISVSPVDTGFYKNSFDHEVEEKEAIVFNTVEYAPYLEYGTVKMKAANNGKGVLWYSVLQNRDTIIVIISSIMSRVI